MATFFENYRKALGEQPFTKYDPIAQQRWAQADTDALDKYAQTESSKTPEQRAAETNERGKASARGTLFLKKDTKNDPNLFEVDPSTSFFSNLQIAQNFDKLNKIIDDYESAKGWDKKQRIIKEGYDSFPNKSTELTQWFDNFAKLTAKSADPEDEFRDEPEEIAGAMRYYLTSARDKYFQKV